MRYKYLLVCDNNRYGMKIIAGERDAGTAREKKQEKLTKGLDKIDVGIIL